MTTKCEYAEIGDPDCPTAELLATAVEIILELCDHEGAEEFSYDLRRRVDRFLADVNG